MSDETTPVGEPERPTLSRDQWEHLIPEEDRTQFDGMNDLPTVLKSFAYLKRNQGNKIRRPDQVPEEERNSYYSKHFGTPETSEGYELPEDAPDYLKSLREQAFQARTPKEAFSSLTKAVMEQQSQAVGEFEEKWGTLAEEIKGSYGDSFETAQAQAMRAYGALSPEVQQLLDQQPEAKTALFRGLVDMGAKMTGSLIPSSGSTGSPNEDSEGSKLERGRKQKDRIFEIIEEMKQFPSNMDERNPRYRELNTELKARKAQLVKMGFSSAFDPKLEATAPDFS